MRPVNAHVFRTAVKFPTGLGLTVDFPVTGVVVVPAEAAGTNDYIAQRILTIAPLRMAALTRTAPRHVATVASTLMLTPDVRRTLRLDQDARLPQPGLEHADTTTDCKACEAAARCTMSEAAWLKLRLQIEEMCDDVVKSHPDFRTALEARLNQLVTP